MSFVSDMPRSAFRSARAAISVALDGSVYLHSVKHKEGKIKPRPYSTAAAFLSVARKRGAAPSAALNQPLPLSTTKANVLVLGDSISSAEIGYFSEVVRELGPGVAAQQVSTLLSGECGTSIGVLSCLDGWLADRVGWDVISMNWGLHDICPKMYYPISRAEYEAHIETMIAKFTAALKPGGKLLWVSSTPVPPSYKKRNNSDVVDINKRASSIFERHGIAQEDLYADAVAECRKNATTRGYPQTSDCPQLQPNGVHFGFVNVSSAGRNFTGQCVARAIRKLL